MQDSIPESKIEELDLSNNKLCDDSTEGLAKALKPGKINTIYTLNLSNTKLTSFGAAILFTSFGKNPFLNKLILDYNNFSD